MRKCLFGSVQTSTLDMEHVCDQVFEGTKIPSVHLVHVIAREVIQD